CTPLYTPVVTRPIHGARPFGASLQLFKIVPDDFVATVRLALPALVTFLKHLLGSCALADTGWVAQAFLRLLSLDPKCRPVVCKVPT
ncbi:MAG: hypothetical protein ACFCVA_06195, partial [Gammaproteobacteria bacterium]